VAVGEGVEKRQGEAGDGRTLGDAVGRRGLRERLSLDEPQRVPQDPFRLARVVYRGDVRVVEGGGQLGLVKEPRGEIGVVDLPGPQDLERLDPPEPAVADLDDDGVAPLSEDLEELVARPEQRPGQREDAGGVRQSSSGRAGSREASTETKSGDGLSVRRVPLFGVGSSASFIECRTRG